MVREVITYECEACGALFFDNVKAQMHETSLANRTKPYLFGMGDTGFLDLSYLGEEGLAVGGGQLVYPVRIVGRYTSPRSHENLYDAEIREGNTPIGKGHIWNSRPEHSISTKKPQLAERA